MLTLSETRPVMDKLRRRYTANELNKKKAVAVLRAWIRESQKHDEGDLIELFKAGWLE